MVELMTGFELFLTLSMIVVVIMLLNVLDGLRKARVEATELRKSLDGLRVRQGDMKRQRTDHANPRVDARVVRTRRGDEDLPRTGRMTTGLKRTLRDGRQSAND